MTNLKRWWCSWTTEEIGNYRPLTDPPSENILGWWFCGFNKKHCAVISAIVAADTKQQAWEFIDLDFPVDKDTRPCQEIPTNYILNEKFFPLSDWMVKRGLK
jgi:hypothetical protein